ncbi:multidrug and toxin extrusion protein 1-like [Mixophyes fleayi]|uniref:multidrug and toxin extrusion protein 1-like n=1 Tax=Mixophyes fleayi TaxID=3061075 RepID=UPI003F4DB50B
MYVLIFIPALPATFMYHLQAKYLQNQGIVFPQVITGLIANILNALINYIFLYVLGLGVMGSAMANTMSQYLEAVLLFCYIMWKKLHVDTWGVQSFNDRLVVPHTTECYLQKDGDMTRWTTACFEDWGSFIRLAIPSMLMLCIEWWAFEIGIILSGILGVEDLGAQSVIYQLATIFFMVPLGYGIAACVLVGQALGAGDIAQAKKSMVVAIIMTEACALISCILLVSLKDVIGYVFTSDEGIVTLVSYVLPVYAVCQLFDGCVATCSGILRGTGKQKIGAIFNAIGFYVVGLPVGISLMFAAKIGILGFWLGILISVLIQTITFLIFVFKIDWSKATREAQARAKERETMTHDRNDKPAINQPAASMEDPEESRKVILTDPETDHRPDFSENQDHQGNVTYQDKRLYWRKLIVQRSLLLIGAITTLMIGILIRLSV